MALQSGSWSSPLVIACSLLGGLFGCGSPPRMPVQDQAFGLVVARFAPQMRAEGTGLKEPLVFWWTTPCPGTNVSAVIRGPRCYSGLYERDGSVAVAWRGSFGHSAYAHELMHYFLEQNFGDSDVAHQQEARWSLVQETDLELQAQGL